MSDATGISWADSTFNPWVGCSKVSPGCAHCYAETWSNRYNRAVWGEEGTRVRTSAANWRKPLQWQRNHAAFEAETGHRRRVFCASLADVFEPRHELADWRDDLFWLIQQTPDLDWLLLTKRPDHARDWLADWRGLAGPELPKDMPSNIWLGTSIENARHTWRADVLRTIPATIRFLSCEPLLGSLFSSSGLTEAGSVGSDRQGGGLEGETVPGERRMLALSRNAEGQRVGETRNLLDLTGIDWVIVGGESGGRTARPMKAEWVREILAACRYEWSKEDGVFSENRPALHFKQWGSHDADGVYRGTAPTSGGKLLDGVEWCEVPSSPHLTLT